MKSSLVNKLVLIGALAQAMAFAADKSVTCVISRDGGEPSVAIQQKIEPGLWIEGAPQQKVRVGQRVVAVSSNYGSVYVSVYDEETAVTGPALFNGEYKNLEGAKEDYGFTGKVRLSAPNQPGREAAFYCYQN